LDSLSGLFKVALKVVATWAFKMRLDMRTHMTGLLVQPKQFSTNWEQSWKSWLFGQKFAVRMYLASERIVAWTKQMELF
jgi:hypothetical protein